MFDQDLNRPLPPADVISDLLLVVLPVYFLRRIKINHRKRIMIFSAFSASLLITAVTILHSIMLFTVHSSGIIVIGHAKVSHVRSVILSWGVIQRGQRGRERKHRFSSLDAPATRRLHHPIIRSILIFMTHVAYTVIDSALADRVQLTRDRGVRVPYMSPRQRSRCDGRSNVVHECGSGHGLLGERCGQVHDDDHTTFDGVGDVSLDDDRNDRS